MPVGQILNFSIGLKKAIDLDDDKLSLALLAEAVIATGNAGFSNEEDIYRAAWRYQ